MPPLFRFTTNVGENWVNYELFVTNVLSVIDCQLSAVMY